MSKPLLIGVLLILFSFFLFILLLVFYYDQQNHMNGIEMKLISKSQIEVDIYQGYQLLCHFSMLKKNIVNSSWKFNCPYYILLIVYADRPML